MPEGSPAMPRARRWLEHRWYSPTSPPLLRPFAALYGLVIAARRALYGGGMLARRHPGVPVVVIGNLAVGGTGKTPLVAWFALRLRERGVPVGVVLRGYGGRAAGPGLVDAGSDPSEVGDEAVLLAQATGCPVAVGANRVAAAELLAARGCALVLADDGLQHLALRPDLAIAVIDGGRGLGNGALLPAGPLREPASRLAEVDFVVVNGPDRCGVAAGMAAIPMTLQPRPLRPLQAQAALADQGALPLSFLEGRAVHAVAGIGNPGRFFDQLRSLGASPVEHAFPDHHRYSAGDLAFGDSLAIVMTEKDAVKCRSFAAPHMYSLPVAAQLPDADAARLVARVLALIPARREARA